MHMASVLAAVHPGKRSIQGGYFSELAMSNISLDWRGPDSA